MSSYTSEATQHTARKSHKCYWCGEAINPGDVYTSWRGVSDGSWHTTRVHPECNDAWLEGLSLDPCYYSEEVREGDHSRGCLCGNRDCECKERDGE